MREKLRKIDKDKARYLLFYTILFAVSFFFCFQLYFSNYYKTYMFTYDALDNNYPFFIAVGRWWRLLVKNFTINHTFEIPMWDMSIGYGGDIITTLGNGFNNFFNPFYIISAFCPSSYSEIAFKIVLILQIYFAGLSFTALASYRQKYSKYAILIGSLVYAFSSNTFIVFKQLSFGYAFIIFPLIILGIWKIRDGKKPYLFIASVISMFAYSYYFTFMAVVLLLVYYLLLVIESLITSKGKSLKDELKIVIKLAISSIYAGAVGICLILPSIIAITKLNRLNVEYYTTLFRDRYYANRLISGFVSYFDGWTDDMMGFPIIALICVFTLFIFTKFKEDLRVKLLFLISSAALFIPYAGQIINGFSYSTNRWTWAYTLLVSFIITMTFDKLYNAKIWKLAVLIGLLGVYKLVLLLGFDSNSPAQNAPLILGVLVIVFIMISRFINRDDFEKIMVLITVLALAVPPFFYFSPRYGNIISKLCQNNTAYTNLAQSGGKEALTLAADDSLYRYDSMSGRLKNSSLITGTSGYDTYNSIYNPYINQFDADMAFTASASPSIINGICKRSDLEALLGTKYVLRNLNEQDVPLPYGYSNNIGNYLNEDGNTYEIYKTGYGSSIVSFYTNAVDEEFYDSLNSYDKQQLLMKAIVLPEVSSGYEYKKAEPVAYTLELDPYIEVRGDVLKLNSTNAYINLDLDQEIEGSGEWYLYAKNFINHSPYERSFKVHVYCVSDYVPTEEELEALLKEKEKSDTLPETEDGEEEEIPKETLTGIGQINAYTNTNHMYGGKDTWMVNSGITEGKAKQIRLVIEETGEYTFDEISLYFESEEQLEKNISGLDHPARDVSINGNTITTHVTTEESGYVLLTVPYSEGWTATVDGQKADILKADRAFMALEVAAGDHEIVLHYKTPYLTAGLAGAFVFIAGGIALAVLQEKNVLVFKKKKA